MKVFIPNEYHATIHDIDLLKLYESGKRIILTDLDNTLVDYDNELPTEEIVNLKNKALEIGFDLVIVSNNIHKRVKKFADSLGIEYYHSAKKPLKITFKKIIKNMNKDEVVFIGDQLLTDIWGGNRMGLYTILVDPIKINNEKITTRFNRFFEKRIHRKINIKG